MPINVNICNLALGHVFAPEIADPEEDTREAQVCRRFYQHCFDVLIERFDWSFCTRIQSLAALVTNDRASEWGYAYSLPADCATPLRLVPTDIGGVYKSLDWPFDYNVPALWQSTYEVQNGTLYSNVSGAVLEYTTNAPDDSRLTAMFRDALSKYLAAYIVMPLTNAGADAKKALLQDAEVATLRAIADDQNRNPRRTSVDYNEVGAARNGAHF